MISLHNVWKSYPGVQALRGVDLRIEPGTIHGIFGPNGAGKTTLLKVISGLTRPDSGEVTIGEVDVVATPEYARSFMGIQLELPAVYDSLTLKQYFTFFGRMGGLKDEDLRQRVLEIMDIIEMGNLANQKVAKFSIGQRQRMEIGRAILNRPQILMLDEPFIALDYDFRKQLQKFLRIFIEKGRIVIITSHNLAEAKRLIDTYSLISRGQLTDAETAKEYLGAHHYHLHTDNDEEAVSLLDNLEGVVSLIKEENYLNFSLAAPRYLPAIVKLLQDHSLELVYLEAANDLEASYKELMRR